MITLTKLSETATKITLGWTPVPGAKGYIMWREKSPTIAIPSGGVRPIYSQSYDPMKAEAVFSKDSAWYKVEALGVTEAGEYPATAPPPPGGQALTRFADFVSPWLDMFFLKRWKDTNWVPLAFTGTTWSDGSGIFDDGARFRFKQGSVVPRASGGGVQMASYLGGQSYGPRVITGKVKFPSTNNPTGFPAYGDWNVIFEFVDGSHTIRNAFGVDALAVGGPKLYVTTYGGPGFPGHLNNKKAHAPTKLEFDREYAFRWELNLSKGSDGYARFYIDGVKILDHTGATLSSDYGAKLWSQWGWYGGMNAQTNEVVVSELWTTTPSLMLRGLTALRSLRVQKSPPPSVLVDPNWPRQ